MATDGGPLSSQTRNPDTVLGGLIVLHGWLMPASLVSALNSISGLQAVNDGVTGRQPRGLAFLPVTQPQTGAFRPAGQE